MSKAVRATAVLMLLNTLFTGAFAQGIGINTNTPDPSSILEIASNDRGLLIPRLTKAERDAIANPALGLMIFNTTSECLDYRLSNGWYSICGECLDISTVTTPPANDAVCQTDTASFSVAASGLNLLYQWQESQNGGSSWSSLSDNATYAGTATDSLSVAQPSPAMDGYLYRAIVSGDCNSSDTSAAATLTITLPTPANAGSDIIAGCSTTVTLAGNDPSPGTGVWAVVSGQGSGFSFGNSAAYNSTFSGQSGETYLLSWTTTTDCGVSDDTVSVALGAEIPPAIQSGLLAYYPFCGNGQDVSGNDYHLTSIGAVLTTDRFGNSNSAYVFDGSGDYMTTSNTPFASLQAHTVSMFIKRSGTGDNWPRLFINGNVNSAITITQFDNTQDILYRLRNSSGNNDMSTTATPLDNTWKHYVFTYDGSLRKIYVNGSLLQQQSGAITINTASGSNAYFGGDPVSSLNGSLDEIAVWNRALSQTEVTQLYNALGN